MPQGYFRDRILWIALFWSRYIHVTSWKTKTTKAWYEGCTTEVKGQKTLYMYVPNTGTNAYQVKSAYQPIMAHQAGAHPSFYPPLDGMLVNRRLAPSIKYDSTYLYTWVERGTMRVKCHAQEHNTMSPARARTWTAHSGVKRTNHEATAPPANAYSLAKLMQVNEQFYCCKILLSK